MLLDELEVLERRAFRKDRLSRRQFTRFLRSSRARVIRVRQGSARQLVGYAIVTWAGSIARLYAIGTLPRMRRQGVASDLLETAEDIARRHNCERIRLEVRPRNRAAITLYRKIGYEQFGRMRRFYDDGSDALRFEKLLPVKPHRGVV